MLGLWATMRTDTPSTYPSFLYTVVSMISEPHIDAFILLVVTKKEDRKSCHAVNSNEQAPLLKLVSHSPS